MRSSFGPSRQKLEGIALAALAVVVTACSGNATSTSSAASQSLPRSAAPIASPLAYAFQKVDDPAGTNNQVTGINDNAEIIGLYYSSGSTTIYNSYTSQRNGSSQYTTFTLTNWPDAHIYQTHGGTYMSGIATTVTYTQPIAAGYAYSPAGLPGGGQGSEFGVWGVADNQGLWTLLKLHDKQRAHLCISTELNGINASGDSVGTYGDPFNSCILRAFDFIPGQGYSDLTPKNGSNPAPYTSTAQGINDGLHVVGWLQASQSSSKTKGWYAIPQGTSCGTSYCYTILTFLNTGDSTKFYGINKANVVVGSYTENNVTHGLLARIGTSNVSWERIDEPSANSVTVVSGINDNGEICGWYDDAHGNLHGFVGSPVARSKSRGHQAH